MKISQFLAVAALSLGLTQIAYANNHEAKDGAQTAAMSHEQDAGAAKDAKMDSATHEAMPEKAHKKGHKKGHKKAEMKDQKADASAK